ncbi:MAG: HicB family protein [Candidatus Omnitrophica bacterium CG11_big_fil_rev_8_21_14_0_20_63_9]|nr:MAG: HicB family protein [Candidatus Omnitrophica bacterium CG11_big_fil_rev_8_21_14_0_20_63_9]
MRKFTVVLESEPEGGYSVFVPSLPGCASQGETKEEALANIREAIEGYLLSLRDEGLSIPVTRVTLTEIEVTA